MEWSFVFFLNSVLLGVGLAMDAFSVSMANGLHDPKMTKSSMVKIAGTFAIFQAAMPMIGWVCVHTIVELFASFETLIPWIALALLGYIGGKMLLDGIRGEEAEEAAQLSAGALFMQGIQDHVVPYGQAVGMARMVNERAGEGTATLELFPDADHGDPTMKTDEVINRIIDFIDDALWDGPHARTPLPAEVKVLS